MVGWNEVSKTATWGTPGPRTSRAATMPFRFAGLCSGARSMQSSICSMHGVVDHAPSGLKRLAAMDDPVPDGVDVGQRRRSRRVGAGATSQRRT